MPGHPGSVVILTCSQSQVTSAVLITLIVSGRSEVQKLQEHILQTYDSYKVIYLDNMNFYSAKGLLVCLSIH